jgi:hypothetical protein
VESSANPNVCEDHRNRFNISQLGIVREALSQWNSILPFILESESDEIMKSKNEGIRPFRHREFNYLGPIGPNCASEWVSYGTGDEEKKVCGSLQLSERAIGIDGKKESKKMCRL